MIDRECYEVIDGKMSCEKSKDCVEKLALIHHVLVDYCLKIVSFFELLMGKVSLILPEKPFKVSWPFFFEWDNVFDDSWKASRVLSFMPFNPLTM